MVSNTKIWITTSFIGFHRWPEAPKAVSYLANTHRHNFLIRVEVSPRDPSDRCVEFHLLQELINRAIEDFLPNLPDDFSCESLALALASSLKSNQYSSISVDISEDGECGATVTLENF